MRMLAEKVDLPLIVAEGYDFVDYFRTVAGHEGERCSHCYRMRLRKTASVALERGFDAFTTTLLISPYQRHDLLREMGEGIGGEVGVVFCYRDFRPGFREGHRLAGEYGLYRQAYCGCLYSEWERYTKSKL